MKRPFTLSNGIYSIRENFLFVKRFLKNFGRNDILGIRPLPYPSPAGAGEGKKNPTVGVSETPFLIMSCRAECSGVETSLPHYNEDIPRLRSE